MAKKLLRCITPLFGVLLLAVMSWMLHLELAEHSPRDIFGQVAALAWPRLGLALGLTLLAYAGMIGYDLLGLRYVNRALPARRLVPVSLLSYVFSNNVGFFALSGGAVRLRFYPAWGLSTGDVFKLLAFTTTGFWAGLFSVAGVVFAVAPVPLPESPYLPLASTRPLGVAFLGLVSAYVLLCAFRKDPVRVGRREFTLPSLRLALGQLAVGAVDWVLAAATLYALLPDWNAVPFAACACMFLLAQVVALVSHVPGGLGVFEAVMVLLLKPACPPEVALGVLLVYRVIYYLLPLVVGTAALGGFELAQRRRAVHRLGHLYSHWAGVVVPDVLAVLSFVAGVGYLLSGAALHRLGWVGALLPLPTVRVSPFTGSLAAVVLILLARALRQRFDGAYWLAVGLLGLGVVAALRNGVAFGVGYGQAGVLAVLLAALLPCRREFYRRASLLSDRFTPNWIGGVGAVLLALSWLTLFAYKYARYSRQMWWQFELYGPAPAMLRAAVGASALALIVVGWRLLRPARRQHPLPSPAKLDQARSLAERSPSTYAYLALLGDKSLAYNEERTAFVMYSVRGRSWVAMGDPVGRPEAGEGLARDFHERCTRAGGRPVFYQVQPANLHVYVDMGLSFVKLGEEGRVPLTGFSLQGRSRKNLRHMLNKAKDAGYSFRMVPADEVAALMPQLRAISDAWLASRDLHEKGFSLGFFDESYLARFPIAVVEQNGKPVAFANVWPGAGRAELSIDLMRHLPDASNGVMDMLFVELMLWGAAQDYRWFNLGMAPLSGLADNALAPLWSRFGAMIYQHGENFYNFRGLRNYKEKFDPLWEPRYLACPGGLAVPGVLVDVLTLIGRRRRRPAPAPAPSGPLQACARVVP